MFDVAALLIYLTLNRDVPIRDLQAKFGSESGTWVYNVLRGVEFAEVAAKTDVKSMLSSKNFKPYLRTWDEIVSSAGSRWNLANIPVMV